MLQPASQCQWKNADSAFPPQRYYEASLIYREVLKLDASSGEAEQELKRAQTLHLMVGEGRVYTGSRGGTQNASSKAQRKDTPSFCVLRNAALHAKWCKTDVNRGRALLEHFSIGGICQIIKKYI